MLIQLNPVLRLFHEQQANNDQQAKKAVSATPNNANSKSFFEQEEGNAQSQAIDKPSFSVVGVENAGCFLISRTVPHKQNNLRCTIELVDANILQYLRDLQKYETQSQEQPNLQPPSYPAAFRKVLCVFHISTASNTVVVAASMNCTGTILSFTTLRTANAAKLYETFFVELTIPEAQRKLILFKRGAEYQRLMFVHDPELKNPYSFLFVSGDFTHKIELLRLNVAISRSGIITVKDKDQTTILKKISQSSVWCHWDYGHDIFYHIYKESQNPSNNNNSNNSSPVSSPSNRLGSPMHNPFEQPAFFLECLQVTPTTIMHVYRYTLPLSSTIQMHANVPVAPSLGQCCLFPHDTHFDFQLVRLRNNVDVLCRQQPHPTKPTTDIIITVYMLHHQQTRKFTIRLDKSNNPRKHRVVFGGINDILYAFIPGLFLKLIDCGVHHKDPRSFITLRKNKDNFITDIEGVSENVPHNLVSLNVRIKNKAFLLNLNNGEVYECTFSLNHFIKWLDEQPDCENYTQVMHWAITHLQNQHFAEQIIRSLSSKQLSCMGSDVMKEYILANVYLACKKSPEMQKEFISLLKNSVLDHSSKPTIFDLMHQTREWKCTVTPPRYFTAVAENSPTKVSQMQHVLDHINDRELDAYSASWKFLYFSCVKYVLAKAKVTKQWLIPKVAKEFTSMIMAEIDKLYKIIKSMGVSMLNTSLFDDSDRKWYFHLLEQMYIAFEELAIPLPEDFHFTFCKFGFESLSRRLFIQYLSRDMFFITLPVMNYVAAKVPQDSELLSLLHRKMYIKQISNGSERQVASSSQSGSVAAKAASAASAAAQIAKRRAEVVPPEIAREISQLIVNEENTNNIMTYYHDLLVNEMAASSRAAQNKVASQLQLLLTQFLEEGASGGSNSADSLPMDEPRLASPSSSPSADKKIMGVKSRKNEGEDDDNDNAALSVERGQFTPLSSFLFSVGLMQREALTKNVVDAERYLRENSIKLLQRNTPL